MNRPIKFRVWDKVQNKFLPSYGNLGVDFYHEQGESWHSKGIRDIVPVSWFLTDHNNNLGNYIIKQYTGLTDKNGKEIFEGDIVQLEDASYKYEVVWNKWQWGIDSKGIVADFIQGFTSAVEDRTIVIGNIFEHEHLLK